MIIQHIRTRKGKPIGTLVAFCDDEGLIRMGWSKVHPKDTFTKKMGVRIAKGRALSNRVYLMEKIPRQIRASTPSFVRRCEHAFNRMLPGFYNRQFGMALEESVPEPTRKSLPHKAELSV